MIIIETNVNDYDMLYYTIDFENIALYMNILFKKLSCFKSKILFLILPFMARETGDKDYIERRDIIENFLRQKINHFGFNFIDMQTYYNKFDILPFFTQIDRVHQPEGIMRILGKTIIKNMHKFHFHTHKEETKSKFLITTAPELFKEKLESKKLANSLFEEYIYKLDFDMKLKFSEKFKNFQLMGIALCNFFENIDNTAYASFIVENKEKKIIKKIKSSFF
ncbi:hypothetical protein [uncultured Campylobacter sp.]|uniref:hypothetical protein n=1 Tax=uncultured Campylobacter sp. TaxID=218934 RepID=UPI002626AB19|nr:hypothetical protein [uncultured Campylobacter sp.]